MNLFKLLFGINKNKLNDDLFSIEFYPLTERYYPKYKNYYLKKNFYTGIVELKDDYLFAYADYSISENGAWKIILKFKEHYLKENVITIRK